MARLHMHLEAAEEPCGYLQGLQATMEYKLMTDVNPEELELLLEHGWRRFGATYFRPVCASCRECVSLRVPVARFAPSKSQRRALRSCSGLRVNVRAPVADEERFALYLAWHRMREETRGWKTSCETLENYAETFCFPHPCAREFDYFDGERLVGVGFVDETPRAASSVYFFYDPEWSGRSLGSASVLFEVAWAGDRGRDHLYLGYRVQGCASTAYKARYRPHELLHGSVPLDMPACWEPG